MSPRSLLLLVLVLPLAVVGCGGGEGALSGGVLDVTLADYQFDPADWTVPAGEEVELVFTNQDDIAHDISIGRQVVEEEGRPLGYDQDLLATVDFTVDPSGARSQSVSGPPSTLITVGPDQTVTLTVTFPESVVGAWEVGCFHSEGCQYNAGLRGTLEITE